MRFALPLAGLLAVGVLAPLAAHLLSRRPPSPRPFPTLRFLRTSPTSARRLRTLHDRGLWALRTLIVLVVSVAATGPTLVTAAREATWRPPIVRALVVDRGVTAAEPRDADEASPPDAVTWSYSSRPVRESLAAALADLAERSDASREVVIRWNGSRRHLGLTDVASIPPQIGIRLDVVDMAGGNAQPSGDVVIAAADEDEAARAVVLSTAPWAASDPPPLVTWPGATTREAVEREAVSASAHLGEVFRRMRHDPRLVDAAQRSRRDARVAASDDDRLDRTRFAPLARDAQGTVLLWGAMRDARAVLVLDARPRDPLALWSLRVADDASRAVYGWPAVDEPWTRDQIAAAQRAPGTVGAMRLPAGLDTRWWWLGALVLVLVEGLVRRDTRGAPS